MNLAMPDLEILRQFPVFRNLSAEQLARVAGLTTRKSIRRRRVIFRQGDVSAGFYAVVRGAISLCREQADGAQHVLRIFRAGETFAEASLMPEGRYPATARAECDSEVLLVSRAGFMALLEQDAGLAMRMVISLSMRIHQLTGLFEERVRRSPRERLLAWVLSRCPANGVVSCEIAMDCTKNALAAELGMRPETLSRQFARLSAEGVLMALSRKVNVPSIATIRQMVQSG